MYIQLFLISIPIFIICDLLWIGVFARDFYQTKLGHILGPVNWYAAGIFYVIFIAALTYFATAPGVMAGSLMKTALLGAAFGLVTYATYDLTNHATIKNWPMVVTVVDIAWGACLGAVVSSVAYSIYTYLIG